MDLSRDPLPVKPFPVSPADVPEAAVRAVMRTARRQGRPMDVEDEDDARLIVAMVIAALAPDPAP